MNAAVQCSSTFTAPELTLGIDNERSEGNENDKINKKRPGDLTEYIAWVCRGGRDDHSFISSLSELMFEDM